jgi:hypothetical protein
MAKQRETTRGFRFLHPAYAVLLLSFAILFFPSTALAAGPTYVSGEASTTWDVAGSPYVVTGEVAVPIGGVLTIEAGVTVSFEAGHAMWVNGALFAVGTPEGIITFTSANAVPAKGDWNKLNFASTSRAIVKHSNIKYANYGICNFSANASIENCVIEGNKYVGIEDHGGAAIKSCVIKNNGSSGNEAYGGINIYGPRTLVTLCTIEGNSYTGIYIGTGTFSMLPITIYKNKISTNAIGIFGDANSTYPPVVLIRENEVSSNTNKGLRLQNANYFLFFNRIKDNNIGIDGCNNNCAAIIAYGNNITGNTVAVQNIYWPADFSNNYWGTTTGPSTSGANSIPSSRVLYAPWISYEVGNASPTAIYSVELKTNKTYSTTLEAGAQLGALNNLYIQAVGDDPSSEAVNWTQATVKSPSYLSGIKVDLLETAKGSGVYRGSTRIVMDVIARWRGLFHMIANQNIADPMDWIIALPEDLVEISSDVSPEANDSVQVGYETRWRADDNPQRIMGYYYVNNYGGLRVVAPNSFYIEPGVRVEFGPFMGLFFWPATGQLLNFSAIGTPEGRITFTTIDPNPQATQGLWNFVYFEGGPYDLATTKFCDFEHGGRGGPVVYAQMDISYCNFRFNERAAIATAYFYANNIYDNITGMEGGSNGLLKFNNIYGNSTQVLFQSQGIFLPNCYWGGGSPPALTGAGGKTDPWFEKPVDTSFHETAAINKITLSLHSDFADPLEADDEVGCFDTVFVSVEASDPSTEAYNFLVLSAETDSASGRFFVCENQPNSGGIYNGRIFTHYTYTYGAAGYIKARVGNTLKVSSLIDPAKSAQVKVSGISTWEEDESPVSLFSGGADYPYTHNITAGQALYIKPGVTVECYPLSSFRAEAGATIKAEGEEGKPIHFRYAFADLTYPDTYRKWSGLLLNNIVGSSFMHVIFQSSSGSPLTLGGSSSTIEDSTFVFNEVGPVLQTSNNLIKNCVIVNNKRGIYVQNGSGHDGYVITYRPVIDGCVIKDNWEDGILSNAAKTKLTIKRSTIEANGASNIRIEHGIADIWENRIKNADENGYNVFLTVKASFESRVNYNDISNDSLYSDTGLKYDAAQITMDATENYWGAPIGPLVPGYRLGNSLCQAKEWPYVRIEPFSTREVKTLEGPLATNEFPATGSATTDAYVPVRIKIIDPQGVDASTIRLIVGGREHDTSDLWLTYDPLTSYLTFATNESYSEGAIEVSLASANDIAGNPLQNPYTWEFYLDYTKPVVAAASALPSPASAEIISVAVNFSDLSGMDTSVAPTVEFVPSGESAGIPFRGTSYTLFTWTGTAEVLPGYGNGTAEIKVSGGRDLAGNIMEPSLEAGHFFIDTVPPSIEVIRPNGGEVAKVLEMGSTYEIMYLVADPSQSGGMPANPVSIYYSINGGLTYPYLITSETDNTGSYFWTLPFLNTTEAKIKVEALDSAGNLGQGKSSGTFEVRIDNPYVVSTSPTNGETGVWTGSKIEILFSKWMDRASVETATAISPTVERTSQWRREPPIEWQERLIFTPDSYLSGNTRYTVTVEAAAADLYGYPLLGGPYIFTFETGGPDILGPIITPVIIDTRTYEAGKDNVMSRSPRIEAQITDEASGVDPGTIRISLGGTQYVPESYHYNILTHWLSYDIADTFAVGTYALTIEAKDHAGNLSTWEGVLRAKAAPTISEVRFDDHPFIAGEIISATPKISAKIMDTNALGQPTTETIDPNSITIEVGLNILNPPPLSYDFGTGILLYDMRDGNIVLGPASYAVSIEASDIYGNTGYWTNQVLRIYSGKVELIGPILSYPTPFKPLSGNPATVAYNLTVDADITIYLYDLAGQVILTKKFKKGLEGGKAGYNSFQWNGMTDMGRVVGNGIYIYKVISKNKIIGTGKLVVLD